MPRRRASTGYCRNKRARSPSPNRRTNRRYRDLPSGSCASANKRSQDDCSCARIVSNSVRRSSAEAGNRLRSRARSRAVRAASESIPPKAAVRLASLSRATSTNGARTSSKARGSSASRKAICAGHASSVSSCRSGGSRRSASASIPDHSGNAVPSRRRTGPRAGRIVSRSRLSQASRRSNRSQSPFPNAWHHASSRSSTRASSPPAGLKSPLRRSSTVLARSTISARSCCDI